MPSTPNTGARPGTLPARGGNVTGGGGAITGPGGGGVAGGGGVIHGPGGGGVAVGGGGVRGPGGGGVAAGGAVVQGPRGNTAVVGGAAIRGPGGNAVAAGRGAAFVNGQFVGGATWGAVNGNFRHWNCFTPGWIGRYSGCWWPGKWAIASTAWATAGWGSTGGYCGCEGDPVYYDYGENLTYDDGTVYSGETAIATAEQYYDQATEIADTGEAAKNEDWMPLGVFSVVSEGQIKSDKVAQLAVNKEGIIRGNLHDTLADTVVQVTGAVDKETQRVAMRMQGNDSVIVETGLYNLTNDEVPVLVHFGSDRQEHRTLVRLQRPEDAPQK